ncbi:MAG TPA: M4 family metallopeptidase [Bacteroidia bacterium]|nr:M4 family metallopeptidase [Bacteroidia bacterium]
MNKTYTTILASCFYSLFFAQQTTIKIEGAKVDFNSSATNLPLQVSFDGSKHISENQFNEWMNNELIKNQEVSFLSIKKNYDKLGYSHNKLQQYYKGYKIEGAIILTHSINNEIKSFNGDWFNDIKLSNSISINESQALQYALSKIGAKRYKWENKAEEAHMQEALNNPNFSYKPVGELCVVPQIDKTSQTVSYSYAYKFNIYAEEPLYRANIYVDAATGKIIKEQNQICTVDAVGTANTKYSGTQPITTDSYSGGYRLRETGRGNGIETYNMNNTQTYGTTDFTNTTNTWTITTANQAATDAHFGAESTYDYYFQTFNRNSIDDNGYKLLSYVHYSTNYVNAFWDGTRMTYGDGSTSQGFTIMTALDVCGHEITHGVVENTCGLNGGEADALNEAFADIFGTSVEWFARPSQHDWIMGKDIMTNGVGIRNMSNPNAIQQPDTYQGTYWDNTGEPHTNDGPCIYWFYLLSVGGSGTNDKSQAYNVTGITMAKAEAIAYRAMTTYMTPSTDYAAVRNYCIQAAKDLYGACSNEVIQTTNAWYAVGVGSQYVAGTIGTNFAANQLSSCALPTTINFNNTTAAGQTFVWDFGDGTTSTAINPSHSYSVNGTYSVKLVATGCAVGSKDSLIKSSYITINAPLAPSSSDINVCSNTSGTLTATGNGMVMWYDAVGGNLLGTGNSFATPTLTNSTTYYAVNSVSQAPMYGGPATNTVFGGGSNFNGNTVHYQIFDVIQPCILKTVKVVANSAGNRTIELRDAAGAVLQSTVVNIPVGTQTVTLNFSLTPGSNYQLGLSGTLADMWRNNTGSGYPYSIGSLVNITNSDVGSSYYYFFYNWQVQQNDCVSPATAVTASVSVCTGLNEATVENNIQLYPNPATDKLTFNLSQELVNTVKSIEIYDALGKHVKSVSVNSELTHISVSDLSTGVYTCRLVNTSNQTIIKRFVKE